MNDFYMIENHPADSRVRIDESGTCQTLSARCGTGGGNVPLVMFVANRYAQYEEGLPTLRASGGDIGGGSEGLIVYESISDSNRGAVREQSSGELYRAGRVQQHAPGDRKDKP